jgi:maleamate amidohydrolase
MRDADEVDLYAASGYGERPVGFGERPVVLTIDFQRAVTDPASPMGRSELVRDALDNTVFLVKEARMAGVPVISCVTAYHPDGVDRPRWKVGAVHDWTEGSWSAELDDRLVDPRDVVVVKKAPSIFFGTSVAAVVTGHNADTVIITGANTSGCIRASVIESFSYGWHTIVPRECVGDQAVVPHEQNLQDVDRRYADVVSLEQVVGHIRALSPASQSVERLG